MKNTYSNDDITEFIKNLDVRAREFDAAKIAQVKNRGYAEMMTLSKHLFSGEEVVDLGPYYDLGETELTFDVEDNVNEVYDLYLTIEGDQVLPHGVTTIQGVNQYRNNNTFYKDNRSVGRVHLDLTNEDQVFDTAIVKYFYTPNATTEDLYMDAQTYLSFQDAMWVAVNYFLKDIEGESQKRASLQRTITSVSKEPEDETTFHRSVFG